MWGGRREGCMHRGPASPFVASVTTISGNKHLLSQMLIPGHVHIMTACAFAHSCPVASGNPKSPRASGIVCTADLWTQLQSGPLPDLHRELQPLSQEVALRGTGAPGATARESWEQPVTDRTPQPRLSAVTGRLDRALLTFLSSGSSFLSAYPSYPGAPPGVHPFALGPKGRLKALAAFCKEAYPSATARVVESGGPLVVLVHRFIDRASRNFVCRAAWIVVASPVKIFGILLCAVCFLGAQLGAFLASIPLGF